MRAVVGADLVHLPAVRAGSRRDRRDGAAVRRAGADADHHHAGRCLRVRFLGDGEPSTWRSRLKPGITTAVPVPDETVAVVVDGAAPYAGGVRTRTTRGAMFLPLRTPLFDQVLPEVTPALPTD